MRKQSSDSNLISFPDHSPLCMSQDLFAQAMNEDPGPLFFDERQNTAEYRADNHEVTTFLDQFFFSSQDTHSKMLKQDDAQILKKSSNSNTHGKMGKRNDTQKRNSRNVFMEEVRKDSPVRRKRGRPIKSCGKQRKTSRNRRGRPSNSELPLHQQFYKAAGLNVSRNKFARALPLLHSTWRDGYKAEGKFSELPSNSPQREQLVYESLSKTFRQKCLGERGIFLSGHLKQTLRKQFDRIKLSQTRHQRESAQKCYIEFVMKMLKANHYGAHSEDLWYSFCHFFWGHSRHIAVEKQLNLRLCRAILELCKKDYILIGMQASDQFWLVTSEQRYFHFLLHFNRQSQKIRLPRYQPPSWPQRVFTITFQPEQLREGSEFSKFQNSQAEDLDRLEALSQSTHHVRQPLQQNSYC